MFSRVNEKDSLLEMIVIFGELKVFELIWVTYNVIAAAVILLRRWSFDDSRPPLEK